MYRFIPARILMFLLGFLLLELAALVIVGSEAGFLTMLAIVIGTGILGSTLARRQGTGVMLRVVTEVTLGRLPGKPLLEGALILFGAILLLLPGLVGDCVGLVLMIPQVRFLVIRRAQNYLQRRFRLQPAVPRPSATQPGGVIDVEFDRE